jgi:hypothetical protein
MLSVYRLHGNKNLLCKANELEPNRQLLTADSDLSSFIMLHPMGFKEFIQIRHGISNRAANPNVRRAGSVHPCLPEPYAGHPDVLRSVGFIEYLYRFLFWHTPSC